MTTWLFYLWLQSHETTQAAQLRSFLPATFYSCFLLSLVGVFASKIIPPLIWYVGSP
jgi:hypothetical protein